MTNTNANANAKKINLEWTEINDHAKRTNKGTLSVKQNFLLSLDNDALKSDFAKKVKKQMVDTIAYNEKNDNINFTMQNATLDLVLNFFKDLFKDTVHANFIFIELMQEKSKNAIKSMIIKSLCEAYQGDKLAKVKDKCTEINAVYELVEGSFSFAKFVKAFMRKVITNNGKYVIKYDSITDKLYYEEKDEVVDGIEE